MKIDIKYERDEEMISAHCLRDEIQGIVPDAKITVINPDGKSDGMKFTIFCGAIETMESVSKKGAKGLNPKTMRWQIIDKSAKYEVVETGNGCANLTSNKDLVAIAKSKGLIL